MRAKERILLAVLVFGYFIAQGLFMLYMKS